METPGTDTAIETLAEAMAGLRAALGQWVRSIPGGGGVRRATDLAVLLELKPKLAWQLWRVMNAEDAVEAHAHLPGPAGLRIAIEAGAARGAGGGGSGAGSRAAAVERAFEEVRRLGDRHAGDRHALAAMLSSRGGEAARRAEEEFRRMAFAGNSAIWGVRARAQFMMSILHPGRNAEVVDAAAVRGLVDLRRLRANLPWVISRIGCYATPEQRKQRQREPIATPGPSGLPLLTEFSSRPAPELRAIKISETLADVELTGGEAGEEGAVTCVLGEVFRGLPRFATPDHPAGRLTPVLFTPTELYVHDILVHRGAEGVLPWRVNIYGDARGEGFSGTRPRDRVEMGVEVEHLGRGPDVLATAALPRQGELAEWLHGRLGWDAGAFEAYRLRLAYPLTPSMVEVEFDLPAADG